jgi:hypothetical protein
MGSKPSKPSGGGGSGGPGSDYQKAMEKIYGKPNFIAGPPNQSEVDFITSKPSKKINVNQLMNQPMGPGMSKAMAGNTGLTGISEAQANTIIQANKQLNKTFDLNRPDTFQALGQTFGEQGSKYLRPADKQLYAQEMQTVAEGLAAGATPFIGQDGIERLNFNNLGIKDETGATILSKQLPGVTATPPTLGQLGGDISRAFTGYNSLQYTDPTSNVPEMVRTQGLADVLAKAAIPGSTAFRIVKDLYGKGKDFFFPGEEEEEEEFQSLIPRDITIEERVSTPITEKTNVVPVDRFSSGADASAESLLPGPGFRDTQRFDQVAEPVQELPDFLTGSSGRDKPKVLDLREIMGESGGNQGGGNENQQTTPDDPPTDDPSEYEALTRRYLEMAGFTQQQIDEIMAAQGYAMGGLIPPESGPMSAGVASLFKNK